MPLVVVKSSVIQINIQYMVLSMSLIPQPIHLICVAGFAFEVTFMAIRPLPLIK